MERTQQLTRTSPPGARRVLALARNRGSRGVHSSDLDVAGQTADGGKPIRRLPARVDELRNHGHVFEADRQGDRTVRYRLVREVAAVDVALRGPSTDTPPPVPVPVPAAAEPEPLFVLASAPPLNALLHDAEAA
jgi:hypothetical protein